MKKQWFVYILECGDGSYYTGVTTNVDARIKAHAEGKGSKYVYNKGFRKLLFAKPCESKPQAYRYEYEIKKLPRHLKLGWFD